MVFSSAVFLIVFFPVFFAVYFALPGRMAKNIWLLAGSLFFYAWGEPVYVFLMIFSVCMNWLFGLALGEHTASRTAVLVLAIVFNIAVIGFFKYEGFLAANINLIAGKVLIPSLKLPLPVGISFFTLQALSYVIDVYRKQVEPQRSLLYLGMYIACFPQLIAGPIVRYQTIQAQIEERKETLDKFVSGMRLFAIGLAKKVLLANTVAILASKMLAMGGSAIGAVGAWSGLIAYTFQIYFDFAGYSDMAIGLGRMMGFDYLRNFNYPYISKSITEFWRRWHISLSTFFRDYIYIPLGGSRVSNTRWAFNIAIVWAITGLWHGAAWNFVLWGVYYGVLLICEKLVWGSKLRSAPPVMRYVYTISIFVFGWSFFWITNPSQLLDYWKALSGLYGATGSSTLWELTAWEYWPLLIVCVIASTPVCPFIKERVSAVAEHRKPVSVFVAGPCNLRAQSAASLCVHSVRFIGTRKEALLYYAFVAVTDICTIALLVISSISVISGSFNPFIYFQF